MLSLDYSPTLGWLIVKNLPYLPGAVTVAVLRALGHITADQAASVLATYRR